MEGGPNYDDHLLQDVVALKHSVAPVTKTSFSNGQCWPNSPCAAVCYTTRYPETYRIHSHDLLPSFWSLFEAQVQVVPRKTPVDGSESLDIPY